MRDQPGFFDIDERLKRLSDLADRLEAFARAVDLEIFRAELVTALAYSDGSKGGQIVNASLIAAPKQRNT